MIVAAHLRVSNGRTGATTALVVLVIVLKRQLPRGLAAGASDEKLLSLMQLVAMVQVGAQVDCGVLRPVGRGRVTGRRLR